MNISPQSLMQALEKVRSGALSPQLAAYQLLQSSDASDVLETVADLSQPVTVAHLVAELGPPHPLIQRDWEEQIRQLATEFHRYTGTWIDDLTTADLLVDANNRLSLAPPFFNRWSATQTQPTSDLEPQAGTPVAAPEKINESISPLTLTHTESHSLPWHSAPASSLSAAPSSTKAEKLQHKKRSSVMAWKPIVGITCGIALLLLCVWWFGTTHDEEQASQPIAKRNSGSKAISNAFDLNADRDSGPSNRSAELDATIDELVPVAGPDVSAELMLSSDLDLAPSADPLTTSTAIEPETSLDAGTDNDRSQLGLDSFAGGNWQSATDVLKAAHSDDEIAAPEAAPETLAGNEPIDSVSGSDDAQPSEAEEAELDMAEAELATSIHPTSNQVSLPTLVRRSTNEERVAILLPLEPPLQTCSLKTIDSAALKLQQDGSHWLVTTGETRLAQIDVKDKQVHFQWLTEAFKVPAAKQLCNARLLAETGEVGQRKTYDLFLRSTVTADPFQLGFEQSDRKFAWPIQDIPAWTHARWQMDWHLPASVTQHWLEPLDDTVRRRQSAICRFQSTSDESIAIDTRFDWQVGTQIQLRVRHQVAADHPAMRQPISLSRLQSAVEFCTGQLTQGEATLEQLKASYSRARTADRALISDQRDRLELMMSNWQSYRDRLKQYEKLLNELQKQCYLAASLRVVWDDLPNQPQVVFEIKPPEPMEPAPRPTDPTEKRDAEQPKLGDEAKKSKTPPM